MKTSFSHLQQIFIVALFAFCLFFLGGGGKNDNKWLPKTLCLSEINMET